MWSEKTVKEEVPIEEDEASEEKDKDEVTEEKKDEDDEATEKKDDDDEEAEVFAVIYALVLYIKLAAI